MGQASTLQRDDSGAATDIRDVIDLCAGDMAEMTDIARGCPWVNALWPEAAAQGRVAGLNMAGRPAAYPGSLSRNVMRVFDLDVLTVGNANQDQEAAFDLADDFMP